MDTDRFHLSEGDYVPDPDRDTAAVVDRFFDHLAEMARDRALPADLVPGMRVRHRELENANAGMIIDESARYNLRMTLALVAAYRLLLPLLGREDAVDVISRAFTEPLAPLLREGTRAMLDAAPDPFRAMVELSKSRERDAFGSGFTFRRPVDDDQRYHADVHRCFYHDVLADNDAAELTPAMCAWDKAWIEAIDPDEHGFRFDRATTIGLGGTHCPFHFTRTDHIPTTD
ncbi:L-2-amino-thiazoline-4-carboxylic acid hydrolase [Nocardiopsis mangrovi]|uniref:L-2-amino-thiazoline-4-carboxylic acid hydrolase n=1 Tax=Nocardiopsis mangrovi TaxID=1179818 RepID=A0ABV9E7D7_9ACTN